MVTRTSLFGAALYGPNKHIKDDFAGLDAPKLKFNFTISFDTTGMIDLDASSGNDNPWEILFGVKQITRPTPIITYEDVNYYNLMTKVATKIDFGVVTVTLYDDRQNRAHDIFDKYLRAVSPITTQTRTKAGTLQNLSMGEKTSIGPLDDTAKNGPIKSIRVTHFIDPFGKAVTYDYLNPKIQNVTLDELDMTISDVNTITFSFVYDTYNVTTGTASGTTGAPTVPV